MNHKSIILSAAVGGLLIEMGLITKGRSISIDDHLIYQENLSKQVQSDSEINQTILEAQQHLQPSHESINRTLEQAQIIHDKLEEIPKFVGKRDSERLKVALEANREILDKKKQLTQQLQTQDLRLK
ncbi:MAG: hypothetical protein F6K11_33300, partial [Leptolyngbya sp. SIO3F4]|nr:hypothetical protein [Leptolyngbya sp. SIO3F4]